MIEHKVKIEGNVHALPGIQPTSFKNEDALEMVTSLAEKLRSGEVCGVAIVAIQPNGETMLNWNAPDDLSSELYVGASLLVKRMLPE